MKSTARAHALTLALLAALWVFAPAATARAQQAPLPAFAVTTLEGDEVESDQLTTQEQWLLIYVRPGCSPCDDVYKVLKREASQPAVTGKVVVVVGGATAEEAADLAARVPWLPRSAWHADESRQAEEALSVKGTPTVFGVLRGNVAWDLKGATDGQRRLKSILESWINQ